MGSGNPESMEYQNIKTLKAQTKQILQLYPQTRNDDRELVKLVCERYGHDPIEKASSIERCRRWFNNRGKYLPTDERVARKRKLNIQEWRVAMGYPTETGGYTPPSEKNKPKTMEFPSRTQYGVIYKVVDFGSTITCDCPSYKYRQNCGHIRAFKKEEERQRNAAAAQLF